MTTVKRTLVAQAAMDASALLNMRFQSRLVGIAPRRRLMVAEPDGPSTDGGKRVRQSVVLAPVGDTSASPVMCGWLDIAQRRAELRVHEVVRSQFEARFRQEFDVTREQYDALLRDVQALFEMQGVEVAVIEAESTPAARVTLAGAPAPGAASKGVSVLLYLGAALLLVLLGVGAYFVLR